ncbi:MAG TPA: hypothetical protein VGM30_23725 [Puia sp.]
MVRVAAARLTGPSNPGELETITENVLAELWQHRQEFAGEARPGIYTYKILLQHVFAWLKEQKQENRIAFLQKILPIDPVHYTPCPPTPSSPPSCSMPLPSPSSVSSPPSSPMPSPPSSSMSSLKALSASNDRPAAGPDQPLDP